MAMISNFVEIAGEINFDRRNNMCDFQIPGSCQSCKSQIPVILGTIANFIEIVNEMNSY